VSTFKPSVPTLLSFNGGLSRPSGTLYRSRYRKLYNYRGSLGIRHLRRHRQATRASGVLRQHSGNQSDLRSPWKAKVACHARTARYHDRALPGGGGPGHYLRSFRERGQGGCDLDRDDLRRGYGDTECGALMSIKPSHPQEPRAPAQVVRHAI
jgi:hypothetical protein